MAERVRELLREHESRLGPGEAEPVDDASSPAVSLGDPPVPARGWTPDHDALSGWPAGRTDADLTRPRWDGERSWSRWDDDDSRSRWDDDVSRSRWDGGAGDGDRATPVSVWQRLVARLPIRADPGRRGALAVGVAVLLAAVLTGVWLVSQRPHSEPVSAIASVPGTSPLVGTDGATAPVPSVAAGSTAGGAPGSSSTEVVVDVAGKVHRPGLYRLEPGSRIADALTAAGGAIAGVHLDSLNLAAKVVDGQQIVVGLPGRSAAGGAPGGAVDGGSGGGAAGGSPTAAVVSLNSATLEQLETLPGVGPVLGQKILDWRSAHGSFTSIDQLNDVSGIGDITFKELQPLVTL